MPGGDREIVNPLLANRLGPFYQLGTGSLAMLNDYYDSGVELTLRFVNAGQSRPFRRKYNLKC